MIGYKISELLSTKLFHQMNKTELINAIAENAGLNKADAKKALDATISAISEALKKGDKIALVGFGTFSVNERANHHCSQENS